MSTLDAFARRLWSWALAGWWVVDSVRDLEQPLMEEVERDE